MLQTSRLASTAASAALLLALCLSTACAQACGAPRPAAQEPGPLRNASAEKGPGKDQRAARRERTVALLHKTRVSLDFVDTPLQDVLVFLAGVSKLSFTLDRRRVPDPPALTLRVKDATLENALALLCRLTRLDYVVGDRHIVVTTREGVYQLDEKVVRYYKVGYLTKGDVREIVGLIRDTIARGTWGRKHGTLVAYRSGVLSVRHVRRVHRQVGALLKRLRQ